MLVSKMLKVKFIMNREHLNFPPPIQQVKYLQSPPQSYSDYGLPVGYSEPKRLNESDLIIFNGTPPQRDIYNNNQRSQVTQQTQSNVKIVKNSSQKSFPIIYNSFNDHRNEAQMHGMGAKSQNTVRDMPNSQYRHQNEQYNEGLQSDVFQYQQTYSKKIQDYQPENNQFHTFKYLPPQGQPSTAHFLQVPSDNYSQQSQHRTKNAGTAKRSSIHQQINALPFQTIQHLPQEQRNYNSDQHGQPYQHFHQNQPFQHMQSQHFTQSQQPQYSQNMLQTQQVQQFQPAPHFQQSQQVQPIQTFQPTQQIQKMPQLQIGRPQSKIIAPVNITPVSPRPKPQSPHQIFNNYTDDRSKFIQVPQQQYQHFIDHLPICKRSQDQLMQLKMKYQQSSQKQHFYWQQNMTLREQNKRLRDLVGHFQKREKQLVSQREELKTSLMANITKYQQSTLEQLALLVQRYRLELQKKK